MARRVSVRGIVLHESKLLCVRLKKYAGSLRSDSDDDYWCLPGVPSSVDGIIAWRREKEAAVKAILNTTVFTEHSILGTPIVFNPK